MGTIAEKLTYLEGTKSAIKDAIIAKGVEVTDADTFRSYAEKIESIEAGGSCESQSKEINITDNGTRVVTPDEGYLLNQVTVTTNVIAGKPVIPNGISFEGSTWTTFDTDPYDWSQVYSGTNMFKHCVSLSELTGTGIENAYFLDIEGMFYNCYNLKTIPKIQGKPTNIGDAFKYADIIENYLAELDFSETSTIFGAFQQCGDWIQNLDFTNSPIVIATYAFDSCKATTLTNFNFSLLEEAEGMLRNSYVLDTHWNLPNLINAPYMFSGYKGTELHFEGLTLLEKADYMFQSSKVATITGLNLCSIDSNTNVFSAAGSVKNIDGLFNLGEGFTANRTFPLTQCPNLTRESCINIFNTIYDFIGNGSTIRGTLTFAGGTLSRLTAEDKAIAEAKGWTIK